MQDWNTVVIGMLLFGIWMTLLDIRRALLGLWFSIEQSGAAGWTSMHGPEAEIE
jgi:hypothetical protein